ncbi:MAG TPA: LytTR family DNA-binding domain-containing protein [Gammaproteobacteria bacterium]|jgi:two-component system response regulator AlgR|nr:LytTR family DNA-binding domain-containing protein [Gammaproteobacteria bacterium]
MKLLIVDDEVPARERLKSLLREQMGVELAGEAGNGREALELWERTQADVVLLDIRMPVMDGLETARHLAAQERPPAVIFTTAYNEFAVEAFDAHAIAYLLKPVRSEKLSAALTGAGRVNRVQLTQLTAGGAPARRHICAKLRDKLHVVPVESVLCFVADQKYVTVYHTGGELLIDESLKDLEQEFAGRFLRVHRNALVAVAQVERLEKDETGHLQVYMRGLAQPLEVSRRLVSEVRERLRAGH